MKKLWIVTLSLIVIANLFGAFPAAASGITVVKQYGDVSSAFHSQELWDITACNLTVTFDVEFPRLRGGAFVGVTDGALSSLAIPSSAVQTGGSHAVTLTFHSIENTQGTMYAILDGALVSTISSEGQWFSGDDLSMVRIMASVSGNQTIIRNLAVAGCLAVTYVPIEVQPDTTDCISSVGQGAVTAVILGSDDFNIADINPATLNLSGLPVRKSSKTLKAQAMYFDSDSYADLYVQFDAKAGTFAPSGDVAILTGLLYDYTPIEGADVVCLAAG